MQAFDTETFQPGKVPINLEITFPPLSRTVVEVSELLENQRSVPDIEQLIEIVHRDPQVVAAVLRRINSAYYGMRRRFDDLRKAVLMIGFLEVCNIVLTSGFEGLRRTLPSKDCEETYNKILRISLGSAFLSDKLSSKLHLQHRTTAFTSGLLHSVGRLVLLYNHSHSYPSMWRERAPTFKEESDLFGFNSAQLIQSASEYWHLPEMISALISHYHSPDALSNQTYFPLATALNTSASIAEQLAMLPEATPSDEDDAPHEEPFDFSDIQFPESMTELARMRKLDPSDVEDYMKVQLVETRRFVSEMMHA